MGRLRNLVLLLPLAAAGCAAPRVELATAPQVFSSEWREGAGAGEAGAALAGNLGEALGSAELARLIARAKAANADLGVATARIGQARAQLRLARTSMLPVVSASAGLSGTQSSATRGSPFDFSQGFAGIDIAFDLDLFGAGRAGRRAAGSRFVAAAFDREALALIVEAEVARAFAQHAALGDRMALLDRNIGHARELERIIGIRHRLGEATRIETGLQTLQVRQLQVERGRLVEAQARTLNALAVLTGEEAPRFAMRQESLESLRIPAIAAVLPAELLVRRPDILAAEARIAAAQGDVQQARAAFLPRLSLTASGLGQAATLTGPLGATLNAGLNLLAPIFNRSRLRGGLDFATASQLETVESYRAALLTALAEAENALSAIDQSRRREALLAEMIEVARTTARLTRLQYVGGEIDLQRVLDAEQQLIQTEDARAVALQERLEAAIDLHKAMGGSPRL